MRNRSSAGTRSILRAEPLRFLARNPCGAVVTSRATFVTFREDSHIISQSSKKDVKFFLLSLFRSANKNGTKVETKHGICICKPLDVRPMVVSRSFHLAMKPMTARPHPFAIIPILTSVPAQTMESFHDAATFKKARQLERHVPTICVKCMGTN